jgi:hypothetical protein
LTEEIPVPLIRIKIEDLELDLRICEGRLDCDSEVEVDITPELLSEELGSDAEEFADVALDYMCDDDLVTYLGDYLARRDLALRVGPSEKEST